MTKKIAVLVNEDTMQRCSCGGCFEKKKKVIIWKKWVRLCL